MAILPRAAWIASFSLASCTLAQSHLYVLYGGWPGMAIQRLDPGSGAVLSSVPVTGFTEPRGSLTMGKDGFLYSIDGVNRDRLFKINKDTGSGEVVGPTGGVSIGAVAFNPVDGLLYALGTEADHGHELGVYVVDPATGAATRTADIVENSGWRDIVYAFAINSEGVGYFCDVFENSLFSVDLSTGSAQLIGNGGGIFPYSGWLLGLAFNDTGVLYGANLFVDAVVIVNTVNGHHEYVFPSTASGIVFVRPPDVCYSDCNVDGVFNLADFGCFATKFALGDPYADCNGDGQLNLSDFGCFQTKFALGCP